MQTLYVNFEQILVTQMANVRYNLLPHFIYLGTRAGFPVQEAYGGPLALSRANTGVAPILEF